MHSLAATDTAAAAPSSPTPHDTAAAASALLLLVLLLFLLLLLRACRQGTCTACCAKVLSGRVSQPKQKCIPTPLLKEGYVALCCAVPASDVRIQTHQGPAIKRWKAEQANK